MNLEELLKLLTDKEKNFLNKVLSGDIVVTGFTPTVKDNKITASGKKKDVLFSDFIKEKYKEVATSERAVSYKTPTGYTPPRTLDSVTFINDLEITPAETKVKKLTIENLLSEVDKDLTVRQGTISNRVGIYNEEAIVKSYNKFERFKQQHFIDKEYTELDSYKKLPTDISDSKFAANNKKFSLTKEFVDDYIKNKGVLSPEILKKYGPYLSSLSSDESLMGFVGRKISDILLIESYTIESINEAIAAGELSPNGNLKHLYNELNEIDEFKDLLSNPKEIKKLRLTSKNLQEIIVNTQESKEIATAIKNRLGFVPNVVLNPAEEFKSFQTALETKIKRVVFSEDNTKSFNSADNFGDIKNTKFKNSFDELIQTDEYKNSTYSEKVEKVKNLFNNLSLDDMKYITQDKYNNVFQELVADKTIKEDPIKSKLNLSDGDASWELRGDNGKPIRTFESQIEIKAADDSTRTKMQMQNSELQKLNTKNGIIIALTQDTAEGTFTAIRARNLFKLAADGTSVFNDLIAPQASDGGTVRGACRDIRYAGGNIPNNVLKTVK
jgi:hypothetical protein